MRSPLMVATALLISALLWMETAWAQSAGIPLPGLTSPAVSSAGADATAALMAGQQPLTGSVPSGKASAEVLHLSLTEAIDRGLKHNLGLLLGEQGVKMRQGARWIALSALLPNLTAGVSQSVQQINLAALGFTGFPGIPAIIGPFGVFDVRAYLSQPVLDLSARNRLKAESENLKAAEYSYRNTRDLVVLVSSSLYLRAVAGSSRIEATRSELKTAEALYNLAVDQKNAGVAAGIEVLRAQVEMQAQQQRLIVAEKDFMDQKLDLAKAIGLPLGQQFDLTDSVPYAPLRAITLDDALNQAYGDRADYQAALALLRSAEAARKSASGERLPTLGLHADYGDIGSNPGNSHGTFTVAASLRIPIFQGGQVRGKIIEADALLKQQQASVEDLHSRIYYEIQSAFLNVKAADDRVKLARSTRELADAQLMQAQDRFKAGVANNIEVVQAQNAVAVADENYIASLYAYNQAKAILARGVGGAEKNFKQYLLGSGR